MVRWFEYQKWFSEHYDLLKNDLLEPGSIECNNGPIITAKGQPKQAPWVAEWAVIFSDRKYFRVKECFNRMGHPHSGAGYREHCSFHYGSAHPKLDPEGYPETRAADTPDADLRIDIDKHNPHIHVGSPLHIPQSRVDGYSIQDADMMQFLRAVIEHRRSPHRALTELLGITVRP